MRILIIRHPRIGLNFGQEGTDSDSWLKSLWPELLLVSARSLECGTVLGWSNALPTIYRTVPHLKMEKLEPQMSPSFRDVHGPLLVTL